MEGRCDTGVESLLLIRGLEGEVRWKRSKLTIPTANINAFSPASPSSVRRRDSAVRDCQPCSTARAGRASARPGDDRTVKPIVGGHDYSLRDLYKKSHWQVAGATFYQLHFCSSISTIASKAKPGLNFSCRKDSSARRCEFGDGSERGGNDPRSNRPPRGREEVPVQLSRFRLTLIKVIVRQVRILARRAAAQLGDDGTNDLVVSEVLRTNELQIWFLSEHLVNVPLD